MILAFVPIFFKILMSFSCFFMHNILPLGVDCKHKVRWIKSKSSCKNVLILYEIHNCLLSFEIKEMSSLNKILHFWYDVLSLLQFLFPSEIWHIKEKPHVIFRWLHILDRTKYGHMKAKSLIFCCTNSNPDPK